MQVKICGITRATDAQVAAEAGADFVGLIRAAGGRRIAVAEARQIVATLPPQTQPVLLFRNQPRKDVVADVRAVGAGWVQLHGRESATYLAELAAELPGVQLIRAWEVAGAQSAAALAAHLGECHEEGAPVRVVILDAPKGGPHPGYDCLAAVAQALGPLGLRVWCAGGLTPDNLGSAVLPGTYHGVDVARGVESSVGVKDADAVRCFIAAARQLQPAPPPEAL
jgi:phosphoribosylanthranilate isomerase